MHRVLTALLAIVAVAAASAPALGQQEAPPAPRAQPGQGPAAAPTPAPAPDYVETTDFKSQMFEVKHRDPRQLADALRVLGSGFKGTTIASSRDFRTITVRDFPENIATIGAAITRLDVPEPARSDVVLHIHALLASTSGPSSELPAEIRNAVAQLESTLNYRNFQLLAPIVHRTREGLEPAESVGVVELRTGTEPAKQYNYLYGFRSITRTADGRIDLADFQFVVVEKDRVRIESSISLKEGEQVVVGTASLRGQALVIVLSARTVK
jgi:hypothetical protein